jgi:hypothetical protein
MDGVSSAIPLDGRGSLLISLRQGGMAAANAKQCHQESILMDGVPLAIHLDGQINVSNSS